MTDIVKKQSFALANILSKFGISIRHSIALEVMAQLNGAKDWNVFSAQDKAPAALTAAQQNLLGAVVKTQYENYGPTKDGDVIHLVCAGGPDGSFRYMARVDLSVPYALAGVYVRMALRPEFDGAAPQWDLLLLVTLTGRDNRWEATSCNPLAREELHNQTVTVTLKDLNAEPGTVLCPLSGKLHQGGFGILPFVDGCDMPVFEFLMPDRVCDIAQMIAWNTPEQPSRYEKGTRVTVTVGEIAHSFKQRTRAGVISV